MHRFARPLVRQQLILLEVEHSGLDAHPVLHARADTARELSLRCAPARVAAQHGEAVLRHSRACRHHLPDLLP